MRQTDTRRLPTASERASEVLVVGGGPAGLSAATALARRGRTVLVVEREIEAGGVPRHCDHLGFGLRDVHRIMSGPRYAQRLVRTAEAVGVKVWTEAMVTDWTSDGGVSVTSPHGIFTLTPRALILATGARERPRAARLIPGDRPSGVFTTGQLQNAVHLKHQRVGQRAVIVGAELVSLSAVLTLRHAGCQTVAMVTERAHVEAFAPVAKVMAKLLRFELLPRHRVTRIIGRPTLSSVEVEDVVTGSRRVITCDTIVTSGDWIADNELARSGGVAIDPVSKSPVVTTRLATTVPGVFAVGNLVHPVETADIAALGGSHVVAAVEAWITGNGASDMSVRILPSGLLSWVSPTFVDSDAPRPTRGRYLGQVTEFARRPRVTVTQGDCVVKSRRLWWPAVPGRLFRIPDSMFREIRLNHGDVQVNVTLY